MKPNHELPSSLSRIELEKTDDEEFREPTKERVTTEEDAKTIGKKALKTMTQEPQLRTEGRTSIAKLSEEIGIHRADIGALLKRENYKGCGLNLGNGIYFTKEEQDEIASFFIERISTNQLADKLKIPRSDIGALLQTEDYEDCGVRLNKGVYFTKEEQEEIASFFKDKKSIRRIAKEINVSSSDISALLKTEGYGNYGLNLNKSIYLTEEGQKAIVSFFRNNKNVFQLANELNIHRIDVAALLQMGDYKDYGLKLHYGTFLNREECERIASFFKGRINISQLSDEIGVHRADIGALLKRKNYKGCGLNLGNGIYFTKEEQEEIASFFNDRIKITQLANELNVSSSDISALLQTKGHEDYGLKLGRSSYLTKEEQEEIASFFKNHISTKQLATKIKSTYETIDKTVRAYDIQGIRVGTGIYYDKKRQVPEIIDKIEHESPKDSFPETAIRFYLQQAGLKAEKIKPDWMKREETGHNLEIDIFIEFDNPPPPGIGIEYDGERWHPSPEYDADKNDIAREKGVEIIHIRELGCPPMRGDIPCIVRQDRKRSSLEDCIKQVFGRLHLPLPETGIDVSKKGDRGKILDLSINKKEKADTYKSIQTTDINRDGVVIGNVDVA